MNPGVVALVLLAALLHASWNALLKSSGDRLSSLAIMTIGAGLGALPLILLTPLPHTAAWPYILLSGALHTGYNLFLIRAYRIGDFSQSYPIARGSSPLLVAIGAALLVGEKMGGATWIGVGLVSLGIISLAQIKDRHNLSGPIAAFTTGAFIAAYTVTDGIGARASGNALAYSGWLFVLDSAPLALIVMWQQRRWPVLPQARQNWISLAGGVMSLLAYGIVIWAVTLAPMGTVSALRETSVLFAAVIGSLFLGEKLTQRRIVAALLIATGAIVLGMQR
ncbi:drug/metabolite transporter (DMT)-like permease [Herbaspirillum sp. Sphag1AN]|uniref:DMT family transporter n=1 Tax=unclassified Herbaspirillum TaxID=2624150 RepID=UPI00161F61CA|nr:MULTISPECIES: DMT family transporter [unclassified Herbaspirillum]MBB3214496.1 drug/metabolite transporter (DMT)-like permease [Herbaspirillum sp. Sphag1AN]MBB3247664.1 drug/metabolite transporter (DMT)-like permease [Herbaspirillum sp. Sphag64]